MEQHDPRRRGSDSVMHDVTQLNMLPEGYCGSQMLYPGVFVPGTTMMGNTSQGINMDEYARLMGVELAVPSEQQTLAAVNAMQGNMTKMHASQAYFDNFARQRINMLGIFDENVGSSNVHDATSMTLPAGVGNGFGGANGNFNAQAIGAVYTPPTPKPDFAEMPIVYDISVGVLGAGTRHNTQDVASPMGVGRTHVTSQTLPTDMFSMRMKEDPHLFVDMDEDDELALMREARSRERNRDHSRKSRLRKKEFVEALKQEAAHLQMYREMCENSADLLALMTPEPSAILLYLSSSYMRVLGYERHQLEPGETSFLDFVHPASVSCVIGAIDSYLMICFLCRRTFQRFAWRCRSCQMTASHGSVR